MSTAASDEYLYVLGLLAVLGVVGVLGYLYRAWLHLCTYGHWPWEDET